MQSNIVQYTPTLDALQVMPETHSRYHVQTEEVVKLQCVIQGSKYDRIPIFLDC